jgi:hypothetical protein
MGYPDETYPFRNVLGCNVPGWNGSWDKTSLGQNIPSGRTVRPRFCRQKGQNLTEILGTFCPKISGTKNRFGRGRFVRVSADGLVGSDLKQKTISVTLIFVFYPFIVFNTGIDSYR